MVDSPSLSKSLGREHRFTLLTWGIVRFLTFGWAATASAFYPLTGIERNIALWPPEVPVGRWLYRALVAPWLRWDVEWYLRIVRRGYRSGDGTAQFHPLFPWLARLFTDLVRDPLLGLLLTGSLASLVLVVMFGRLARLDLDDEGVRTATLALLTTPMTFVLFAPYSEALFLLLAVACFWFLRRRNWVAAGFMGALASLTRQQGILLLLPALWELWEAHERDVRRGVRDWRAWGALLLIPAGLLLWLVYRAWMLGDLRPNTNSLHALIYSVLISPSATEVVSVQTFLWPWQALFLAVKQAFETLDYLLFIDLGLGLGFVLVFAGVWKHLRGSYRIYALSVVLISFAYHTGPVYPYMGLPRHLLLAFPVFLGLGAILRKPWQWLALVGTGALGMGLLSMLYFLKGWVP